MLRARMKHLALAALLASAGLALGCGSPCQDLAQRICSCQPVGVFRDNCNNAAKNQLSNGPSPTSADEQRCTDLLKTCPDPAHDAFACDEMNTATGKAECGMALP